MGAGQFPAGAGFAGADPVFVPAASPAQVYPRALKYDPITRQFVQNADGSMAEVHPVDQRVAMLLTVEQGSSPSIATVGLSLRKRIARADPKTIPQVASDAIRAVLRPLIEAGDVILVSVETDIATRGRASFAVTYVNLRDPSLNRRNPLLSAQRIVA